MHSRPHSPSCLFSGLLIALLVCSVADAVTVALSASPSRIQITDSFQLELIIEGASGELEWPEIEQDGFQIVSRRQEQSIGFGRRSLTLRYGARPTRVGTLEIPPVSVTIGGKVYTSPSGATVNVLPLRRIDEFFLEVSTSPPRIYPGQEFTVQLEICVRKLRGSYSKRVPFPVTRTGQSNWPQLSIPWFEGVDDFETEDVQSFAKRLSPTTSGEGFPINDYTDSRGFFRSDRILFQLPRANVRRRASDGETYDYFLFKLEKRFRATKPGTYAFGQTIAQGYVFTDVGSSRPQDKKFTASSGDLAVEVLPVPTEGRPATYAGAVGKFRIESSVIPKTAVVGQPMTLKLSVSGEGKLELIAPPDLRAQTKLEELFRIHGQPEAGAISEDGKRKVFTYGIRPKAATIEAVPPIELAYFDPQLEKFVTVRSAAIPIEVEKGERAEIEVYEQKSRTRRHRTVDRPLYPICEEAFAVTAQSPIERVGTLQIALLAAPPVLYLLLLLSVQRRRRHDADPSILRSRNAARAARGVLAEADAGTREGRDAESYEAMGRALTGFVADRVNRPAAGITAAEAIAILEEREVPGELRESVQSLLETVEQARYGALPPGANSGEALREARQCLQKLDRQLR